MKALLYHAAPATAAFVLNVCFQAGVVCLVALIAARLLFRHSPCLRYGVCLAGLVCVLLSPLAVARPGSAVALFTLPSANKRSTEVGGSASLLPGTEPGSGEGRVDPAPLQACGAIPALLGVWVLGMAWHAVRFRHGYRTVCRITSDMQPYLPEDWDTMRASLERDLGGPFPPLRTSPWTASPVAVGLFRPVVILPLGLAETLSPLQLRQVLLHEGAHVTRGHAFGALAERVARLIFWPHPLVTLLCRELGRSREEVCDNVASQESGAACYARTLLAIAQGSDTAPNIHSALALQGPESSLEERIAGLLDPRRNRMIRIQRSKQWAITGAIVAVMAAAAGIRCVAAGNEAKKGKAETSGHVHDADKAKMTADHARRQKLQAEINAAIDARAKQLMAHSSMSAAEAHQRAESQIASQYPRVPSAPATAAEMAAHRKAEAEYAAKHDGAAAGHHQETRAGATEAQAREDKLRAENAERRSHDAQAKPESRAKAP